MTVYLPSGMAGMAGMIALLVAVEVGISEPIAGGAAVVVGLLVFAGWEASDRLPSTNRELGTRREGGGGS